MQAAASSPLRSACGEGHMRQCQGGTGVSKKSFLQMLVCEVEIRRPVFTGYIVRTGSKIIADSAGGEFSRRRLFLRLDSRGSEQFIYWIRMHSPEEFPFRIRPQVLRGAGDEHRARRDERN